MTIRARAAAWGLVALAGLGFASAARASDDWEHSDEADDGITTDNVLFHGAEQVHDLRGQCPRPGLVPRGRTGRSRRTRWWWMG